MTSFLLHVISFILYMMKFITLENLQYSFGSQLKCSNFPYMELNYWPSRNKSSLLYVAPLVCQIFEKFCYLADVK